MKFIIIILFTLSAQANDFKKERTSYYSPLSYTVNIQNKRDINKTLSLVIKNSISKIQKFNKENSKKSKWKFKLNPFTNTVSMIWGDSTSTQYYGNIDEAAKNFLSENYNILDVDIQSIKKITERNFLNTSHIYYIQTYKGIEVEFSYVKLHRNQNNEITHYSARYYKDIKLDTNPTIPLELAVLKIKNELKDFILSTSTIVIYPDDINEKFYLAYKIQGRGGIDIKNGNWVYYIDAKNGEILFKYDQRQYACQLIEETTGTIRGYVYEVSPIPTGDPSSPWLPPNLKNFKDIYVFAESYQSSTTTKSNGEYCIDHDPNETGAKVFFTTLGPYFSVVDYLGNNIFLTNASYQIKSSASSLTVNSYQPNTTTSYTITPTLSIPIGYSLAFITPFFLNFNIGNIDQYGNSTDADVVYITEPLGNRISAFIGANKTNFTAGYIPATSYVAKIVSDSSGTGNFSITASTYIVLTNPQGKNNATGSFNISTSPLTNTFYHLTSIRDFMMNFNSKCLNNCIDLDKRIPVNVNVYSSVNTPLYNAFYDLVQDAIYLGRGPIQGDKNFAWDGTVIRHEYIHLVMNRIYPIIYFGEFGAITEALSDYFSLSSFWNEGINITTLGNFIGVGEGAKRDISSITKRMPNDWVGEVHADGEILSAVLYKLAKGSSQYNLGSFTTGGFAGLNKADVYAFGAMFYFPDSFEGFMEAMVDICRNIEGTGCEETKIRNAFAAHGIISDYIIVDQYEPNNGPTYAIDISSISKIYAYIDYPGDEDYYVLPLGKGLIHLKLELPKHNLGLYHAFTMFLFDEYGNPLAYQMPPTKSDLCYPSYNPQYSQTCLTRNSINEFYYYISTPGLYYVSITAGLNNDYGPGVDYNRTSPYILSYDGELNTSLNITKLISLVDQDVFEFAIRVPKFYYATSLSNNWNNGEVFEFCEKECIKILDSRMIELSNNFITVTDLNDISGPGANYNTLEADGSYYIKGKIKFQSYNGQTFSQRYPYAGTIYFKIYAKNHMFEIGDKTSNYINLGISKPISLTASKDDIITYNNIINENNKEMLIKIESKTTSNITVYVYTATGVLVKKIYKGPIAGKMTLIWDGTDENGNKLPSGIYYIKTEGAINKIEKVGIIR